MVPKSTQKHEHEQVVTPAVSQEGTPISAQDTLGILTQAGIYYIWGEITQGTLKDIHADVLLKHYLGPKKYNSPVQFMVNSCGGDADETWALIDLLANLRFKVATSGFGTCASAGAMLLAAGTKGLRTVAPNCTIMIHRFYGGNSGKHHELLAHRSAEDAEHDKDLAFWSKHSKYKTAAQVEKYLLRKEDTWLTPHQAVQHGIVDQIGGILK